MRKPRVVMALLASLSFVAAACGDDEKEDSSTAAPTTEAAPEETTGDTGAPDTTPAEVDYQWTPNADQIGRAHV